MGLFSVFPLAACQPQASVTQYYKSGIADGSLAGFQSQQEGRFQRQRWLIPSPATNGLMVATIWRPKGLGPFPLVVINHASSQAIKERMPDPSSQYETVSMWFAQRGFVVAVLVRPGHGETGGPYLEDEG